MLFIRSLLFNLVFYISITLQMLFWLPVYFFMKREDCWNVVRIWGITSLWFQNRIVGTVFCFDGLENIPESGGFIVGGKHQSAWETFALLLFLKEPSYILKRELMFIPIFGWFAAKAKVVAVNRGKRSIALAKMTQAASDQLASGRQIVIYPEGTRVAPYASPQYKYGIAHMYSQIGCRVLPVALNSGLYWPRQSFLRYPGTITMQFLPIIEPGLKIGEFRERLETDIEEATNRLMWEAEKMTPSPPLAKIFRKKFEAVIDHEL
jgi:1-acyl-sn-glycerol-3-phosphate acyltransferase